MRRTVFYMAAVLSFFIFTLSCNPANLAPIPKPEGKVLVEKNVKVAMSDGIKLSAQLYHPPGDGPWPVIVNRLPYGHKSVEVIVKNFAGAGYAVFVQDTRGRYGSEGGSEKFYPFMCERNDGRETLAWIEKQPWCNGKIGTWGGSYHGFTQWSLAASNPNLDAMAPLITSTDLYRWHYMGGAFRYEMMLSWGKKNLYRESNDLAGVSKKTFFHLPLIEADDKAESNWPWFDDVMSHPVRDEFWEPLRFTDNINEVNAPALLVSGWYDIFNTDQIRDFEIWQKRGAGAPKANLVVGPWNHMFYNTNLKNVEWGWKDAYEKVVGPCMKWYDRWLRDIHNGVDEEPPVRIFVMGENRWRNFNTWPPEGVVETNLFMHSAGAANSSKGDGKLSFEKPDGDQPPDAYDYDPADPAPTKGGPGLIPWRAGPADQSKNERRDDVLVFSTDALDEPITVIGPVGVVLYASTSEVDTDFTAKLVDVYPDGKAIIVCEGILRGRYREGGAAKLLTPGKIYEWKIDLGYTALRFNPGHRVRLEISSSNFPRFDRNLNTGENLSTSTRIKIAHQKVHHSRTYASRLTLGVLSDR